MSRAGYVIRELKEENQLLKEAISDWVEEIAKLKSRLNSVEGHNEQLLRRLDHIDSQPNKWELVKGY